LEKGDDMKKCTANTACRRSGGGLRPRPRRFSPESMVLKELQGRLYKSFGAINGYTIFIVRIKRLREQDGVGLWQ